MPSDRSDSLVASRRQGTAAIPILVRIGIVVVLLLAVSLSVPYFASVDNAMGLLAQASIVAVAALGLTLVITTGGIDLSVGGVISLSGLVDVILIGAHVPWGVAILIGMLLGGVIGAVNGALVAFLRVPAFVATFGTLGIAAGLALFIANGRRTTVLPDSMIEFGNGTVLQLPYLVIVAVAVLIVLEVALRVTPWSMRLRATGDNFRVAVLVGVPTRPILIGAYVASGALASLAGGMLTAQLSTAGPQQGEPYTLSAIAACVVGGVDLMGGRGRLWASCLGAIFLAGLGNVMNLEGVQPFIQDLATGVLIVVAVLLSTRGREWVARFGESIRKAGLR